MKKYDKNKIFVCFTSAFYFINVNFHEHHLCRCGSSGSSSSGTCNTCAWNVTYNFFPISSSHTYFIMLVDKVRHYNINKIIFKTIFAINYIIIKVRYLLHSYYIEIYMSISCSCAHNVFQHFLIYLYKIQ